MKTADLNRILQTRKDYILERIWDCTYEELDREEKIVFNENMESDRSMLIWLDALHILPDTELLTLKSNQHL